MLHSLISICFKDLFGQQMTSKAGGEIGARGWRENGGLVKEPTDDFDDAAWTFHSKCEWIPDFQRRSVEIGCL